jgi:transposase InsO family protein
VPGAAHDHLRPARGVPGVVLQVAGPCQRTLGRERSAYDAGPPPQHHRPSREIAFGKARGLHGSPRLHADLVDEGWKVSEKTVADSMRRQGLVARRIRRRNGLTRQDKTAPKLPDLLRRNFTAEEPNARWVGDMTEIPTGPDGKGPKLYLATVIDLYSRRLLGAATGLRPDAELACAAIKDGRHRPWWEGRDLA